MLFRSVKRIKTISVSLIKSGQNLYSVLPSFFFFTFLIPNLNRILISGQKLIPDSSPVQKFTLMTVQNPGRHNILHAKKASKNGAQIQPLSHVPFSQFTHCLKYLLPTFWKCCIPKPKKIIFPDLHAASGSIACPHKGEIQFLKVFNVNPTIFSSESLIQKVSEDG